jgi:hypothetical protein
MYLNVNVFLVSEARVSTIGTRKPQGNKKKGVSS